jgi:hypothetical protein
MMMNFMEQAQAQAQMMSEGQQQGQVDPMQLMAQAAQQVAMLNQQNLQQQVEANKQNDPKSQAAIMLAQAELMDSHTQAQKVHQDGEHQRAQVALKSKEIELKHAAELNKNNQIGLKHQAKVDEIVKTKGLDAMIAGLSDSYQHKVNKIEAAHQATLEKSVNREMHSKGPLDSKKK